MRGKERAFHLFLIKVLLLLFLTENSTSVLRNATSIFKCPNGESYLIRYDTNTQQTYNFALTDAKTFSVGSQAGELITLETVDESNCIRNAMEKAELSDNDRTKSCFISGTSNNQFQWVTESGFVFFYDPSGSTQDCYVEDCNWDSKPPSSCYSAPRFCHAYIKVDEEYKMEWADRPDNGLLYCWIVEIKIPSTSPSPTRSSSSSATISKTPTISFSPSKTSSVTPTATSTRTSSISFSPSVSLSGTSSSTPSSTPSPSITRTTSASSTATPSTSAISSSTPSSSPSASSSPSVSASVSSTSTQSISTSTSASPSVTHSTTSTITTSSSSSASITTSHSTSATMTTSPSTSPSITTSSSPSASITTSHSTSATMTTSSSPSTTITTSPSASASVTTSISTSATMTTSISPSATMTTSLSPSATMTTSPSTSSSITTSPSTSTSITTSSSTSPSITISSSTSISRLSSQSTSSSISSSSSPSIFPSFSSTPALSQSVTLSIIIPSLALPPDIIVEPSPLPIRSPDLFSPTPKITNIFRDPYLLLPSPSPFLPPSIIGPGVIVSDVNGGLNIPVTNQNGDVVGSVSFPPSVSGTVFSAAGTVTGANILSQTVDLFYVDANGNIVSNLGFDVEICLNLTSSVASQDACLGYLNSDGDWVCEDRCLSTQGSCDSLCGNTKHFTSFSILLDAGGSKDECGNTTLDAYFWISTAFVLFAILLWFILAIFKDLRVRRRTYLKRRNYTRQESVLRSVNDQERSVI